MSNDNTVKIPYTLVGAIISGVVGILGVLTSVHTFYVAHGIIVLALAFSCDYLISRKMYDTLPPLLQFIGILLLALLFISVNETTLQSLAYTGTPESLMSFTVWIAFTVLLIVLAHSFVKKSVYSILEERNQKSTLLEIFPLYFSLIVYALVVSFFLAPFTYILIKILPTSPQKGFILFSLLAFFTIFSLAIFTVVSFPQKKHMKKYLFALPSFLAGIMLVASKLIVNTLTATFLLMDSAFLALFVYLIVLEDTISKKVIKNLSLVLVLALVPLILLTIGDLLGYHYDVVDCGVNFRVRGNFIVSYGPQELLMYTGSNVTKISPWTLETIDKNVFCNSKFEVMTAFGLLPCHPTQMCEK